MKNVIWVLNNYPPIVLAGAELAAHRINKYLRSIGYSVRVYILSNESYPSEFEGIQIFPLNQFDCYTMNIEPDTILMSQLWATRSAHSIFDRNPSCKYIEFIHYVDNTVISPYPWTTREFTSIFNSNDTKERALTIGNWLRSKPSFVLTPYIDPPKTTPSIRTNVNNYKWITLVNFNKDKGADIFNQLAAKDATRCYVGIKGSHGAQEKPVSQVILLNPSLDMEHIWDNTRILVVLSTYETWSMVASEAMMRGIPVVAANHIQALKENCEDAALYVNRTNTDECISAFKTIEANYEAFSKKSLEQSKLPNYAELAKIIS